MSILDKVESAIDTGRLFTPGDLLAEEQRPKMSVTLEDKLAAMIWYLEEVRSHRRGSDPKAFESYLDDPEVAAWLTAMTKQGRIANTRFTLK